MYIKPESTTPPQIVFKINALFPSIFQNYVGTQTILWWGYPDINGFIVCRCLRGSGDQGRLKGPVNLNVVNSACNPGVACVVPAGQVI